MNVAIFWDIAPRPSHLLHSGFLLGWFSNLKMEVIRSSETSVYIRATQRYIPEDGNIQEGSRLFRNDGTCLSIYTASQYRGSWSWSTSSCEPQISPGFADVIKSLCLFCLKRDIDNGHFTRGPTCVSEFISSVTRSMFIGATNPWNTSRTEEWNTDLYARYIKSISFTDVDKKS
jgi:hypothetical protein